MCIVSVWDDKNILETNASVYSQQCEYTLKMGRMVNFILCIFYHKKLRQKTRKKQNKSKLSAVKDLTIAWQVGEVLALDQMESNK